MMSRHADHAQIGASRRDEPVAVLQVAHRIGVQGVAVGHLRQRVHGLERRAIGTSGRATGRATVRGQRAALPFRIAKNLLGLLRPLGVLGSSLGRGLPRRRHHIGGQRLAGLFHARVGVHGERAGLLRQ